MAISMTMYLPVIMTGVFLLFSFLSYPTAYKKFIGRYTWSWIFLALAFWAYFVAVEYHFPQFKSAWLTFIALIFYAKALHFFFIETTDHYFVEQKRQFFGWLSAILIFGSLIMNFIVGDNHQIIFLVTSLFILIGLFVVNILSAVRHKTLDTILLVFGNSLWILAICSVSFEGFMYFFAFSSHDYCYIIQMGAAFLLFMGSRYRLHAMKEVEIPR